MSGVLGDPAWQGIGAVVAILALLAYVFFDVFRGPRRKHRTGSASLQFYNFTGPHDVADFYRAFIQTVDRATEKIYRSGDGFAADRGGHHQRLLDAERRALERGVDLTRIQTSPRAYGPWAHGVAQLLRDYPGRFRVRADFDSNSNSTLDFGLVDPYGPKPIVTLLVSEPEPSLSGTGSRICAAIFLDGDRALATQLAQAFVARSQALPPMGVSDVEALGSPALYFAYGPHMTLRHMRYFIPEASRYGPAILRGWRLVLGDTGEEERVSARIKQTGDTGDVVEGVVYEISAWARGRLRTLERGPHREVHVQPECMGEAIEAFAFVHLAIDDAPATSGPGADLQIMIEGAEENHYSGLAQRLRDYQREHRHSAAVPHPRRPDEPTFGAVGASELPQSDL